jgi:hypothetical protein
LGWIEGTGINYPANAGEVTWNSQSHGSKLWAGGAGLGSPGGGSYGATPIASLTVTDDSLGAVWDFAVPKVVLDDWITNSADNAGLLLRDAAAPDGEHRALLGSRENVGNEPTLTFDLMPIPEPSSFALLIGLVLGLAVYGRWKR